MKEVIDLVFSGRIPKALFMPFQEIFGNLALLGVAYPVGGCATALKTVPENENIRRYIEMEKFDLILSDPLDLAGPLLSWEYNIALAYNTRWTWGGDAGQALTGEHSSIIANGMTSAKNSNHLTFSDRFWNVLHGLFHFVYRKIVAFKFINPALTAWNYPHSHDYLVASQADLWLLRFNFLFEVPRPMMPNQLAVGAFKCKQGQPLNDEYEEFIADGKGTIIISFGSMIKTIPQQVTEDILMFARAFPEYRFIWRNSNRPEGTPENVKVSSWIPQVDLLADARTKVFVSHCGNHGAHESLFNGVPILAVPLVFDQFYIAGRIADIGAGLKIMPYDLTGNKLIELTNLLLLPKFQDKLYNLQMKMKKMPVADLDLAISHMEYLMEIGNFDHLKSNMVNQTFIEYTNIDVAMVLILLFSCTLMLNLSFLHFIFYRMLPSKVKTE